MREETSTPSFAPPTVATDTLDDFAVRTWYPTLAHVAPLTRSRYSGVYVNHIRPALGHLSLKTIAHEDVQEWVNARSTRGDRPRDVGYGFERLSAILRLARRLKRVQDDPCEFVTLPIVPDEPRERTIDPATALTLLERVKGTDLSAPVYLALVLGLRRGEACGLHWCDLDREARTLRIVRQRQQVKVAGEGKKALKRGEMKRIEENPVKGRQSRVLSLTPRMVEEIDKRGDLDSRSGHICTVLPFGEKTRRAWVPDNLTEQWGKVAQPLGLADWTYHDLRHGASSLLDAAGADLLTRMAVLGHRNLNTALVYAEKTKAARKEAARLAEAIGL